MEVKMEFFKILFCVGLAIVSTVAEEITNATEPNFCGLSEPDSEKTCISIRLPWQEEPIYFCTEKGKISYKDRCGHQINRWCYGAEREHTLKIATPWSCCPITSIPDYCAGQTCPAAPFNRTCEEIPPDSKDPWDCCSTFYCDKDIKAGECHMKRLAPGCMTPPKNKTSCIGFRDQHGCCHKYQCEGEGKPGMCPMEAQALKFKQLMLEAKSQTKSTKGMTTLTKKMELHRHRSILRKFYGGGSATYMRCTGDYTCPGQMKCCSGDIESYHGVRQILSRSSSQNRAVYGYCQEPVDIDDKSDSEGSSTPLTIIDKADSTESTNEAENTVAA